VFDVGGAIGSSSAYDSAERRSCAAGRSAVRRLPAIKQIFDPAGIFNPARLSRRSELLVATCARHSFRPASGSIRSISGIDGLRDLVELQVNWTRRRWPTRRPPATAAARAARSRRICECARSSASPTARKRLPGESESDPRILTGARRWGFSPATSAKISPTCASTATCAAWSARPRSTSAADARDQGRLRGGQRAPPSDWVMTRLICCAAWRACSAGGELGVGQPADALGSGKDAGNRSGRKLPRVVTRSFQRRAARRRLTRPVRRPGDKVAYFVDLYANYHDPNCRSPGGRAGTQRVASTCHHTRGSLACLPSPVGHWSTLDNRLNTISLCWPSACGRLPHRGH